MTSRPYESIVVHDEGGVRRITLNRPERRNALGPVMVNELLWALDDATSDDAVRSVVITGAGNAFCAGGDFSQMTSGSAQPGAARRLRRPLARLWAPPSRSSPA